MHVQLVRVFWSRGRMQSLCPASSGHVLRDDAEFLPRSFLRQRTECVMGGSSNGMLLVLAR